MRERSKLTEKLDSLLLEISPNEALEWRNHPLTQALELALEESLTAVVENWLGGVYVGDTPEQMYALNSKALGQAETIMDIQSWFSDICRKD